MSSTQSNERACQICYDVTAVQIQKICSRECPSVVCSNCLVRSFDITLKDSFHGMLPKLKCPICLNGINEIRWSNLIQIDISTSFQCRLKERVNSMCEIRCPDCDETKSLLPDAKDGVEKFAIEKDKIPELRRLCFQYCNHNLSPSILYDHIMTHGEALLNRVLQLIEDQERRAFLFLYHLYKHPKTFTVCCRHPVCFSCKFSGHHLGVPCETYSEGMIDEFQSMNTIVNCPSCNIQLVKGDGCDSLRCVCGTIRKNTTSRKGLPLPQVAQSTSQKLEFCIKIFPI